MKVMSRGTISIASLALMLSLAPLAYGDSSKELYDKQCASCHTIGGGDTGGPDLKGVTGKRTEEWLVTVITEPGKLTAAKDPVQAELVKKYGYEMPALGISREDALLMIAYLKEDGAAAGGKPAAEPAKPVEIAITPELVARGKALFIGKIPMAKGGAPCTSCHMFKLAGISGGNLASDLTELYEGMGDQGMRGVLKSLKFPIMKKIYADRPLTDDEVTAIVVFAKDATAKKTGGAPALFPFAGFGFLALCIVGLILYKRRTR